MVRNNMYFFGSMYAEVTRVLTFRIVTPKNSRDIVI